jgi:hypothetical protein
MKKQHSIFTILLVALTLCSYSQVTFSVAPGLGLNTAQVGYKVNSKLVPFFGFQYASGNIQYTSTGERYDNDKGEIVSYEDVDKASGAVFLPNLGVKYFLMTKDKISSYGTLSFSVPIITAKTEDRDGETTKLKDEIEKYGAWGTELGFGTEYFFDKSFSIGGEFGIRYIRAKFTDTYETTVFDPNLGSSRPSEDSDGIAASLNPTYTKITLNFYF